GLRGRAGPAARAARRASGLRLSDRFGEPRGDADRPVAPAVDAGVASPAVGDALAVTVALDRVVEAEARAAELAAAGVHRQAVVEARRREVADVRLDRERLDALGPQPGIAAAEPGEVVDPGDLEPDEVDGVVRDSLRVGFREAHLEAGREAELHDRTLYD